jgi:predicted RNase H-like HicB family nuclease
MARVRIIGGNGHKRRNRVFDFTVILMPVREDAPPARGSKERVPRAKNPTKTGYQVTVPLLPGVITYGRNEEEALEMASDAIRCHLDGLRKSGEEIPDEKRAHTARLRVALSA